MGSFFQYYWDELAKTVNENARRHGFWTEGENYSIPVKFALMHSEISEALEAYRHDNPPSEHIPEFSGIEEEMADVIIRIMDVSEELGWRTPEAVIAKIVFNASRPYKHGNKVI